MSSNVPIDAIVLAAGRSRRMGAHKLLLPFAGQTLIGQVVDQVVASPVRNTLVVVPENDDGVSRAVELKPIAIVKNPDRTGEMLSSVRAGIKALARDAKAALIVLGDQPSIRADMIRETVEAFNQVDRGIVAPVYDGKRGHPVLISARYFEEILQRHDDAGLRGLLADHQGDIFELMTSDAGALADVDYPEDYERELSRYNEERARGPSIRK